MFGSGPLLKLAATSERFKTNYNLFKLSNKKPFALFSERLFIYT